MRIMIKILRYLLFISVAVLLLSKWEVLNIRPDILNLIHKGSIFLAVLFAIYYLIKLYRCYQGYWLNCRDSPLC